MSTDQSRERYWRGVFERQRKSGQSIRAYCLANEISQASFYNWRRKLARRRTDSATNAETPGQRIDSTPLVPLKIRPLFAPGGVIELLHPRGHLLRVPSEFDAPSLRRILAVLDEEGT
jgi:transposase-like protein